MSGYHTIDDSASMFKMIRQIKGAYNKQLDGYDRTCIYEIYGSLANDVRRVWELEEDDQITLTEEVTVSGYSEYTRDDYHEFTISAKDKELKFISVAACEEHFS